jgi:hypothetical protein
MSTPPRCPRSNLFRRLRVRASNFLHLVNRNLRMRRGRMVPARIGVGLAVFFLALGLGASIGVWRGLRPALTKLFPERKLLVRPPALRVSLVKLQTQRITDDTLARLRALPGVARVDPQMPATFPLHAEGKLGPMPEPLATEIVVHGVPRDLVADSISASESWHWTLGDNRPCPVVVSSYFLDLYNLGISESLRLPKLNESALKGKGFQLVLGESVITSGAGTGQRREVECDVVGFTRDPNLAGVAMPLSAVRSFNEWYYGKPYIPSYTLVQLETTGADEIEPVTRAIESMGFEVSAPGRLLDRWRWAMRGGLGLALALGLGVLFIALSNVTNTFALILTERREEIGLMEALGATRGLVRRLYTAEIAWVGLVASVIGGGVAWGAAWIATRALARWTADLATLGEFTLAPDPALLAAIVGGVILLSLLVTWPVITRATRRVPAQLLRE